jgi:hypothetical protein
MVHLVELSCVELGWLFTAQDLVYFCSLSNVISILSKVFVPNPGEITNELKFYTATKTGVYLSDFVELSLVDSSIHCEVHKGSFRPYH